MQKNYSVMQAFENRFDLVQYGSEAWGVFALGLKFNIEDIHSVAVNSITDNKNDKKCDIIYIDTDEKVAVIAQNYFSERIKRCAKTGKANDLTTAASWVLLREIDELPILLQSRVRELRDALKEGLIENLEFWYIHNCLENDTIASELTNTELTGTHALTKMYPEHNVKLSAREIGIDTIQKWYNSTKATILVNDEFEVTTSGGFEIINDDWTTFSTSVKADWFYELFLEYNEDIFSANIRSYLGSRNSKSNINNNIKATAENDPNNFLVFNNGITALVNNIELGKRRKKKTGEIVQNAIITGLSIVNGAQTTGALGSLERPPKSSARVPVRFIKCTNQKIIEQIIRYNNSQNVVKPSDFRSTDSIQSKLRTQFADYYSNVTYLGGRRGSSEDAIKRNKNLLISDKVAQSLTAFHLDPMNATHSKSKIWESDDLYANVFNDQTSAEHIVFVYSLYKCLLDYKQDIKDKYKSDDELKDSDKKILEFLSHSGATFVVMSAIAKSIETIIDKPVPNLFDLRFSEDIDYDTAQGYWRNVLECFIPFVTTALTDVIKANVKKPEVLTSSLEQFNSFIQSTRAVNKQQYDNFSSYINIRKITRR